MKKKALFMETTKIPVGQTVAEIQRILGEYGVAGVMTEYDKGDVKAVSFKIVFLNRDVPFRLPCRWEPIYNLFMQRVRKARKTTHQDLAEQAKRVAWRQILRWVEAQLALVETGMVKIHEVFLPYVQMDAAGTTLFQTIEHTKFKMLEAPKRHKEA